MTKVKIQLHVWILCGHNGNIEVFTKYRIESSEAIGQSICGVAFLEKHVTRVGAKIVGMASAYEWVVNRHAGDLLNKGRHSDRGSAPEYLASVVDKHTLNLVLQRKVQTRLCSMYLYRGLQVVW